VLEGSTHSGQVVRPILRTAFAGSKYWQKAHGRSTPVGEQLAIRSTVVGTGVGSPSMKAANAIRHLGRDLRARLLPDCCGFKAVGRHCSGTPV